MDEHKLTNLIDQYLLGTISPEDRSQLETLMISDQTVSTLVRESTAAYKVLKHEKNRRLKEKLRKLDKDEFVHQGFIIKPIGWLAILLMAVIVGLYFLIGYYTPPSIALRNVEPFPIGNTYAASTSEEVAVWEKAHNAFLARDFNVAIQQYVALSDHPEEYKAYVAKWNILLAQLALEGPTPVWKMSFERFIKSAPEPLQSKALRLSGILDSFIYRLFQKQLHGRFSSMKPRLI